MDEYIIFFLEEGIKKNIFHHDSSGRPFPNYNGNLSLSHSVKYTLICFTSRNLVCGLDIQKLDLNLELKYFNQELILSEDCLKDDNRKFLIMTSFKESLGKFLGLGLMAKRNIFDISSIQFTAKKFYKVCFINFPSLMGLGFIKQDFIITIVIPKSDITKYIDSLEELKNEL